MNNDLIDRYLDQLLGYLRGPAHDVRRILAEAEEHLRDAAAEALAAGATEEEAQRQAIARFGDARTVARRFSPRLGPVPFRAVVTELCRAAVVLGAVAMVAVGVSGALAELFGRVWGATFVAGDLPDVTYTPARCSDFFEYFPHAANCEAAASLHHWGEVVGYRVSLGVLGLLVLGGYALLRRRAQRRARGSAAQAQYLGVLPDGFSATVATSLYAVAAAGLLLLSLDSIAVGGAHAGGGQWLSGAIVALAMTAVYGTSWLRTVAGRNADATAVAVDA